MVLLSCMNAAEARGRITSTVCFDCLDWTYLEIILYCALFPEQCSAVLSLGFFSNSESFIQIKWIWIRAAAQGLLPYSPAAYLTKRCSHNVRSDWQLGPSLSPNLFKTWTELLAQYTDSMHTCASACVCMCTFKPVHACMRACVSSSTATGFRAEAVQSDRAFSFSFPVRLLAVAPTVPEASR